MSYLLDTNAYLRLAKSFDPLLGNKYKALPCELQVISDVDTEFSRSSRLQGKFSWAADVGYCDNRKANLVQLKDKEPTSLFTTRSIICGMSDTMKRTGEYKKNDLTPPSPTDCLVLAYAHVKQIKVVSDDGGMAYLASKFGIACVGGCHLLKSMLNEGTVTVPDIKAVYAYLRYEKDLPLYWEQQAKKLFGSAL